MANPNTTILQLATASANNISTSQTPGGAGNLTITGSAASGGVATLDVARRVLISTAGNDSGRTFTIFGTDRNGNVQSEAITGIPNTTSGATVRDFLTVTRISVDAATAGAVTAGTNSIGSSPWVEDNYLAEYWALAGACTGPAGTTYTIELTFDDVDKIGTSLVVSPQQWTRNPLSFVPPKTYYLAAFTSAGVTLDNQFQITPCMAHRLTILSGTGQVVMQSVQSGT